MSKLTKNQKSVADKVEAGKAYTLKEASELVKEITTTKFDASLDIDVRLGVDPRKANQMVRGVVSLPNGTGKVTRVLALCTPDQEAAAKEAGADYVGLDEYVEKIKGGWTDIDVIITMPSCMGKIGPLGRVLGPRGLMPNPKSGTVTMDVAKAVREVKQGKIDFKVDKSGIVHTSLTALATSIVTVPLLGLGINPRGPSTRPSAPILPMMDGIVIITSISVHPPLIFSIYSSRPT